MRVRFLGFLALFEVALLFVVLNIGSDFLLDEQLLRLRVGLAPALGTDRAADHARDLKALSRFEPSPPVRRRLLKDALRIERENSSFGSYLDNVELVDCLEQLADLSLMSSSKTKSESERLALTNEAKGYLQEARSLIHKQNLYWMQNPLKKLLAIYEEVDERNHASELRSDLSSMEHRSENEFEKYVQRRIVRGQYVPGDLERGAAIPFLSDYYRTIGRNYGLAGRTKDSRTYLAQCVEVDSLLAEAHWRIPLDLGELALVNTELGRYGEASKNYADCLRSIIDNDPDVLSMLPQRQAYAALSDLMGKPEQANLARATALDIVAFSEELKKKSRLLSRRLERGDLIQVRTEDFWWSGRILSLEGTRSQVHFIGFPKSQDDWFDVECFRQHPPYGFSDLQGSVPLNAWTSQ